MDFPTAQCLLFVTHSDLFLIHWFFSSDSLQTLGYREMFCPLWLQNRLYTCWGKYTQSLDDGLYISEILTFKKMRQKVCSWVKGLALQAFIYQVRELYSLVTATSVQLPWTLIYEISVVTAVIVSNSPNIYRQLCEKNLPWCQGCIFIVYVNIKYPKLVRILMADLEPRLQAFNFKRRH